MEKEYLVNVTVNTIELFVYAKNKEEAKKKAIKEIQEDPNYFHEINMWVNDEDVQQSDDFDGTIDDILGGLDISNISDDNPFKQALEIGMDSIEMFENRKKEMTKDIKWLKDEVYKLFPSHDEMCNYPDDITVLRTQMLHSVIDLIDQLDEPETVEQTARLLENVLKENKRLGKLLEKKHQEWFNLMDEINNQEVLSDKWIDEHITDGHNVNLGDKVVYADELDGVLVPKQEYFLDTLEDGVYAVKDGRIERGNIATEYTNKETEVLSQKWIDDNSVYASSDGITEEYVHVDDLKELLVPKQKEVKRTQIPEWIIEWYKGANDEFSTLEDVFDNLSHDTGYSTTGSDKLRSHIMKYGGYSKMYEALSHIYFGAYEIEEKQKYIVVLGKSIYNTTTYGQIGEVNSKKIMQSVYANEEGIIAPNQYTKSEILEVKDGEGIFKRFAVKVEELEE